MTITDTSGTNDSFTTYQTAARAQRSSAEWVVEAPSSNWGVLPLANFGSVTFTSATATINGVTGPIDSSSWQSTAINMASGQTLEDSTSAVTDTASSSSFTVTYDSSGSSTSGNGMRTAKGLSRPGMIRAVMPALSTASQQAPKGGLGLSGVDQFFAALGRA